jgi:hypothetical protein
MAVAVNASRATKLFNDADSDGKVTPGDTLITHIIVNNPTATQITNVVVNDTLTSNTTYVAGTIVVTIGDQYTGLAGNTPISFTAAEGLLANDYHFDGPNAGNNTGLTVVSIDQAGTHGTVSFNSNGSFTFTPETGYVGTTSFVYHTSDGSGTVGTGTVTLTIASQVWYVDSAYAGANGASDGSYLKPFTDFTNLNNAGIDKDAAGDSIVVHGNPSGANFVLEAGETLYGDGVLHKVNDAYTVNGVTHNTGATTVTSGSGTSTMTGSAGAVITLSTNNTIDGVTVSTDGATVGITDNGGSVTTAGGTLTIAHTAVSGSSQGVAITHGGNLAASFTTLSSSGGGNAINLAGTATSGIGLLSGSFAATAGTITGNTGVAVQFGGAVANSSTADFSYGGAITNAGGDAVHVVNKAGGTTTFSGNITTTVTAGIDVSGNTGGTVSFTGQSLSLSSTTAAAVNLTNNTGSTITFNPTVGGNGLDVITTTGAGVVFTGGGTLNIQGSGNSVQTATGHILDFASGTIGASGVTFASLSSTGTVSGNAVAFSSVTGGSIASTTTTVAGATGHGISVASTGSAINLGTGSIGDAAGQELFISAGAGDFTYNGTMAKTSNGLAVQIQNHTGGAVALGGAISSTSASDGISLTGNTGSTVNFAGNLTLNTSASGTNAFTATGGGTVSATNTASTINSGTGTAINVANTTIGAGGLHFQSVTATGGNVSAIILNTTGTSGGLTITGTGTTANSGGVISGIATGGLGTPAISLTNTANFNISNMQIANTGDSAIEASNLQGTNSITGTVIEDWDVTNSATKYGLHIVNNNTNMTSMIVSTSTFDGSSANTASDAVSDGILMEAQGTSNMGLKVQNSTFIHMYGDAIQVTSITGSTGTENLRVLNNNFTTALGTNGGGGISLTPFGGVHLFADINTNTFNTLGPVGNVNTGIIGGTVGITAQADITIRNNTITNVPGSRGINFVVDGGQARINIDNNTISGLNSNHEAISINALKNTSVVPNTTGAVDVTINNNHIGIGSASGWTYAGSLTADAIDLIAQQGATLTAAVTNNVVNSQTAGNVLRARASGSGTLNATITNNTLNDTNAADANPGQLDLSAGTINTDAGGHIVSLISGNTITGGTAQIIHFGVGVNAPVSISVTQASTAAVAAANGGATVTGTPTAFNGATPPAPTPPTVPASPLIVAPPAPVDTTTIVGEKPVSDPVVSTAQEQGGATGTSATSPAAAAASSAVTMSLTQAQLDTMVAAAIDRWAAAGATPEQIAAMKAVSVTVADIAGLQVGDSTPGHILVSSSGGGYGWFLDATPDDDVEFSGSGTALNAEPGTLPYGHVDLLTVIEHELGHQIGVEDDYNPLDKADLMYGFIDPGERRLAGANDVAAATGTPVGHEAFALSSVGIASLVAGNSFDVSYQSTVNAFAPGFTPTLTGSSTITYTGGGPLTTSESINATNDTMTDSNNVVTTQTLAVATLTLGNLVYQDNDNSGTFNAGDTGIGNVGVKLYIDNGTTPGAWDVSDQLLVSTVTSNVSATLGQYSFTGLAPGDYIVVVGKTNFNSGQPLNGLIPHNIGVDPDNNLDGDNNGRAQASGDVASLPITLSYDNEPNAGAGNDTNNTLDFGFQANSPPVANGDNPTVAEDSGANVINVRANDSDPDAGDSFTVTAVNTAGTQGAVQITNSGADVTYTPASNYNGADSFTYTITDSHGATATATVNLTVSAVNDAVGATAPATFSLNEDAGSTAVAGLSISDVDATLAPAGVYEVTLSSTHGAMSLTTITGLTFTAGDGTADATMTFHGTLAAINTALGTAHYAPASNYNGAAQIQLDVTDTFNSIVATGSGAATNATKVVAVTVNSVNDAPLGADENTSVRDTATHAFTVAEFTNGYTDVENNSLLAVKIDTLPAQGTLQLNGSGVAIGDFVPASEIAAGHLVYIPASNTGGQSFNFKFQVQDNGGVANGGIDLDPNQHTFTLNVFHVNQEPAGANAIATVNEDGKDVFSAGDFGFLDVDGNALLAVKIATAPTHGTIYFDADNDANTPDTALAAGDSMTKAGLDAGLYYYSPDPDYNGSDGYTFQVQDNGGTSNGGVDTDQTPNSYAITVNSVNDAPSGSDNSSTADLGTTYAFTAGDFANGFTDPNDSPPNGFAGIVVTTIPTTGTLKLNGTALVGGETVTLAQLNAGNLTYDAPASGSSESFTFQVRDDGTTANGGIDLDPSANTFTFNLTSTTDNDAPINHLPVSQAVDEDGTLVFTPGSGNPISVTDPDAGLNELTVTLSVEHGVLSLSGTAGLTFSGAGDGTSDATMTFSGMQSAINAALNGLTYTPTGDYNGPDTLSIDTSDNGNTGAGGVKTATNALAITVDPVNDQPVVTPTANANATEQTAVILNPSWSIADLDLDARNGGSGDYDGSELAVTTLDPNSVFGFDTTGASFTVSGSNLVDSGNNVFATFSTSGGLTIDFTSLGTTATTALVNDVAQHITYTNTSDAPPASVQVGYLFDDGAPGAGQGTVVSNNNLAGGLINVSIAAVNDAPVNSLGGTIGTGEDAINAWLSGMSVSDADAGSNDIRVTFHVDHGTLHIATSGVVGGITAGDIVSGQNSDTIIVQASQSEIDATLAATNGLTYSPTPDYNGTDTLTVTTNDRGFTGADPGGADPNSEETVSTRTIQISAVDDPPVAQDDAVSTPENQVLNGNLFADNGNGADSDVEGDPFSVSEVNGSSANVGATITLASGAKLTVNADGTFTYDPNGKWNYEISSATAAATGAVNDGATESFTYKLGNGNTATVVVNVTGVDGPGDQLWGNSGNNTITGTPNGDFFWVVQGGDDDLKGLGGNDLFFFGAALTSADKADGGAGTDQIALQGNYPALTFGTGVTSIESLAILPGSDTRFGDPGTNSYSYNITTVEENVGPGTQMVVDANRLRPGEDFTFNGSAETDGSFWIYGGRGTDQLTGGSQSDLFLFGTDGSGQLRWGASDTVDGGAGIDQLALRGNYTIVFGANQIHSIESFALLSALDTRFGALGDRYSYDLTMNNGNLASGVQMTVDGAKLKAGETFTFNGSAELDGSFRVFGGNDADHLVGSQGNDILVGGPGADYLDGQAGNDIFRYRGASESSSTHFDTINGFDQAHDVIDLPGAVAAWSATAVVSQGSLSSASFDSDLATAVDAALDPNSALLFTPNAGTYSGQTFLIVDANGDGSYEADLDYVIHLTNPVSPITTTDTHIFV